MPKRILCLYFDFKSCKLFFQHFFFPNLKQFHKKSSFLQNVTFLCNFLFFPERLTSLERLAEDQGSLLHLEYFEHLYIFFFQRSIYSLHIMKSCLKQWIDLSLTLQLQLTLNVSQNCPALVRHGIILHFPAKINIFCPLLRFPFTVYSTSLPKQIPFLHLSCYLVALLDLEAWVTAFLSGLRWDLDVASLSCLCSWLRCLCRLGLRVGEDDSSWFSKSGLSSFLWPRRWCLVLLASLDLLSGFLQAVIFGR